MIRFFLALATAAALSSIGASAQTSGGLTEAEVENGYVQAFYARMDGQPTVAETILAQLVRARPNYPQLRFDLGVAQAEQGRCAAAARTFARGRDLNQTPSYDRAVDAAMADLCPRLAPFDTELGLSLVYDTNINGGATSRDVTINGVPYTLNDDAMAQAAAGYRIRGGVAYNHQISQTTYLVPHLSFGLTDVNKDEYDQLSIEGGVAFRYRGDKVDWRAGPTLYYGFDQEGSSLQGYGLSGRLAYTIDARSGLYVNAGWMDVEDKRNALRDYTLASVSLRYVRQFERNMLAHASVFYTDKNYSDDLQDLASVTVSIGLQGSVTPTIGFDLGLSQTWNRGSVEHPFFQQTRRDSVTSVYANLSFAQFEGWWGRPYVGVGYTVSNSSFPTKDFDQTSMNFGITRSF